MKIGHSPLSETELGLALRVLKDGDFILEQSLYPVPEYTFKHPLTQEVALHSQLKERRRRGAAALGVRAQPGADAPAYQRDRTAWCHRVFTRPRTLVAAWNTNH